jgi:hypothetical protein
MPTHAGAAAGRTGRGARSLSGSGRTDVGAQSLASQLKEKRSEMIISELEAMALRLFDERGFGYT